MDRAAHLVVILKFRTVWSQTGPNQKMVFSPNRVLYSKKDSGFRTVPKNTLKIQDCHGILRLFL